MSDYEPTSAVSASSVPAGSSPGWPVSATMAGQACQPRVRPSLSRMKRGLIAAAALMGSVTGLFVGLGASSTASAAQPVAASGSPGHLGSGGQRSNARSGPAPGGSSGTVGSVSKSSFTLTTSAGQEVTVNELSSTKYKKGTSSTSKSALSKGNHGLVLGTVSSTTIKATQVIVQTTGGGSRRSTAATVVPFQKGAAETSKEVGQIPASYSQGSGTIVSGTTANKATKPRWRLIPVGIVDGCREAEQRRIRGPQHRRELAALLFVNQDFKVVGAN